MQNKRPRILLAVGLLAASACLDGPTDVAPRLGETASLESAAGARSIRVYTQNLYVGADVDAVLAALMTPDRDDDFQALLAAVETLGKTSFPTRATAIVDQIARERPHVVGLQEVSDIHIDLSGFGGPVVDISFLPIIEAQLAARGLNYDLAATVKNIDASLLGGAIGLVDYDAILVNADLVHVADAYGKTFNLNLSDLLPPGTLPVDLRRGFVYVRATIDGDHYQLVNTHLEPDLGDYDLSGLRAAQASEIAGVLAGTTPAFVMGDLNDRPGTLMYQVLRQAGFQDVWQELRPGADGFTAGEGYTDDHRADLSNPLNGFTQRIDYIWARNTGHPTAGLQGRIVRFGVEPADKVDGPYFKIWPSDHAGLVAALLVPVAAATVR